MTPFRVLKATRKNFICFYNLRCHFTALVINRFSDPMTLKCLKLKLQMFRTESSLWQNQDQLRSWKNKTNKIKRKVTNNAPKSNLTPVCFKIDKVLKEGDW